MNMFKAIFLGLQSRPVYLKTASPNAAKHRRVKARRAMTKASRRANR